MAAGQSPSDRLHWAVLYDDLTTAEALIEFGADGKAATCYGVTPIALTAMNEQAGMIRPPLSSP
jgi:hypothetical protein